MDLDLGRIESKCDWGTGYIIIFLKPGTVACPWNFNIGSRNRRVLRSCLPVVLGKSVSSQFSERLLLKK